ncbi:patatin-like phospholipase family protein [Tissierella sp. Yu-01]|uniref:patatin-like phospholipase family protein n=1 Tax=Tissierella sp. Yu-01 TaxID=3035694 RepID=UPI00240D3030|nr:patatin-like phospholipase family protein [Tissierella sp. Yu-01]WFA07853.1 patatin-like phospholipase family protein [Tissierella sp. Yu-01]
MYGLVLEGGGAKGSYHIGAYKAIMEEGIEIGGIAGTSIGAINGAMIVQGDYEKALKLWNDIKYSMVIDANDEEMERLRKIRLGREDLRLLADKIKLVITDRGFDITPFKNLLATYIDESKIRSSNMDFGMVTINLTDLKPIKVFKEDIPEGELKDYLLASAYLPAFKNEKLGGKRYLDGAFYDNLPFKLLQLKGYDDLIIVRTYGRGRTRRLNPNINAIVIAPSDDIGDSFAFDYEIARRNIELGYYDGLKALRGLKGKKYYIESKGEDFFFDMLINITQEQLNKLREQIKTTNIPDRRALFEYIIPRTASVLGLHKTYDYEDFILALLEKKAENLGLDRFHIYSYEELLNRVKCAPGKIDHIYEHNGKLNKLLEKVDLASIFNKEEVLLNIADIIMNCYRH